MPTHDNSQTQMDLYDGLAPSVDANGVIDDISFKQNVVAKTADYTIKASETGTVFTNRGATAAVTFTLPALADGLVYEFFVVADFSLTVAAPTADTLIAYNDVAADSVGWATASEIIGNGFKAICDGTQWVVLCYPGDAAATLTVTTA